MNSASADWRSTCSSSHGTRNWTWQLLGELNADQPTARTYLTHALHLWQTFGADQQAGAITAKLQRLAK